MSIRYSLSGLLLSLLQIAYSSSHPKNALSPLESLRPLSNRTLVSPGDVFELGFFSLPSSGKRWYIGVWYKNISERPYVWVANRDQPLLDSNGTFGISDSKLEIRNQANALVWSAELRSQGSPVVAELLANGNFVVKSKGSEDLLWQSFDFPTDTLLPQMKLGLDHKTSHTKRFLTSWKSLDDPSSGDFQFRLQNDQNSPDLSVWIGDERLYHCGPWNGYKFQNIPPFFNVSWARVDDACLFTETSKTSFSRLIMADTGLLVHETWNQSTTKWDSSWSSLEDDCHLYNLCGANAYCHLNTTQPCTCIQEFEPRYGNVVVNECIRKRPLQCGSSNFTILEKMSFRHTKDMSYPGESQIHCQKICVADCKCTAFAFAMTNGTSVCIFWRSDILDLKQDSNEGQDLFIKLNETKKKKEKKKKEKKKKKTNRKGKIIGLGVGIPTVIIIFSLAGYCFWKRKQNQATARESRAATVVEVMMPSDTDMSGADIIENRHMDFGLILRATDNFSESNEIGHGGFGKVYKGHLQDGEYIAVKKLLQTSTQGIAEFKNEVRVIASLQHINLVRLLGWSAFDEEKLLIYELLENGSLESHLFGGTSQSSRLNWQTRFDIIFGIARGLEYMQEESRVKIIHRDLKPGNILLDRDMVPKISDFGLARISRKYQEEAITVQSAGTYGYMSPEYAGEGIYSTKSDIYSFGVIVLEIISGKKNRTFSLIDPNNANLLSYVWINLMNGSWETTVDEILHESLQSSQILRCIEIGLLCVQQLVEDRPKMSSVVMMLGNETTEIPKPKQPGFFIGKNPNDPSSSTGQPSSVNRCTVSNVSPR